MLIAALDIATTTGVALGAPRARPEHYTVKLGAGDMGARFAMLSRTVCAIIQQRGVTEIAVERPLILAHSAAATDTLRYLVGAVGVAHAAAAACGVPCAEYEIRTIRKHFLGAVPRKSADAKRLVMDRCRLLGWDPANDNEGDALALLDYALSLRAPLHGAVSGALMGAARWSA